MLANKHLGWICSVLKEPNSEKVKEPRVEQRRPGRECIVRVASLWTRKLTPCELSAFGFGCDVLLLGSEETGAESLKRWGRALTAMRPRDWVVLWGGR